MRIDVTYADRAPRVIETAGEALLSASTMAGAPEWRGASLPVTAAMLRPRTDLLMQEGYGLVVELCAWSAATDGWREEAVITDFGHETGAPRMQFHVFRVWEVLPPEDVARVTDIEIDGRIHVMRVGGRLLDLTCYERLEGTLLSRSECNEHPLHQRVLLVHERLRRERPGLSDGQLGDVYGLGDALFEYASLLEGVDDHDDAPVPEDGLGGFASAYGSADTGEGRISAVMDAMLGVDDVTADGLRHALDARGIDASGLGVAWEEAEGRMDDADGAWDDPDWDDFG